MIALREARAAEVVTPLLDLLSKTAPVERVRAVADPRIEIIEQTNSLYVIAESAQHQMIEQLTGEPPGGTDPPEGADPPGDEHGEGGGR